ncbi:hypothetical protein G7Z17_g7183 [Cylindrodendrum hubeiense]|uniref:Uncharacterized protein n=1 Tax=Cylindrodendrum hubeiense TaxID=595255 RepID=A0A9P5H3E6_9HYPO|nr:hypothetical protein G7Z17_g7183 [Cylindrodendrum hubeiense]
MAGGVQYKRAVALDREQTTERLERCDRQGRAPGSGVVSSATVAFAATLRLCVSASLRLCVSASCTEFGRHPVVTWLVFWLSGWPTAGLESLPALQHATTTPQSRTTLSRPAIAAASSG